MIRKQLLKMQYFFCYNKYFLYLCISRFSVLGYLKCTKPGGMHYCSWIGAGVNVGCIYHFPPRAPCFCIGGGEEMPLSKRVTDKMQDTHEDALYWFAMKVRFKRTDPIKQQLEEDAVRYYIPEMVPSLVFVNATRAYIKQFETLFFGRIWIYRDLLSNKPQPIPEREMEVFMFVCSAGKQGLSFLGDDKPEYHQGDLVRVIDGPFKGAEGHIKRIKKDRRLVVSIKGVAAVAMTYIHPQFLEIVH